MLSLGLSLTFSDFTRIFKYPKALFIGLTAQMILLPLIAFLLMWMSSLSPAMKVGVILIAICPGGATSNMINYLLRGNLALVVSLTAINSFISLFTIPALLLFTFHTFFLETIQVTNLSLDFWNMLFNIFIITLLPTIIGILIRLKFPQLAKKSQPTLKIITPVFLALAIIGSIFFEKSTLDISIGWQEYLNVIPWLLILHFTSMVGSYLLSRFTMGLNNPTSMSIGIEVGLQNTVLAMAIAFSMLHSPEIAIPASIYSLFSFFTTATFGIIVSKTKLSVKDIIFGQVENKKI